MFLSHLFFDNLLTSLFTHQMCYVCISIRLWAFEHGNLRSESEVGTITIVLIVITVSRRSYTISQFQKDIIFQSHHFHMTHRVNVFTKPDLHERLHSDMFFIMVRKMRQQWFMLFAAVLWRRLMPGMFEANYQLDSLYRADSSYRVRCSIAISIIWCDSLTGFVFYGPKMMTLFVFLRLWV